MTTLTPKQSPSEQNQHGLQSTQPAHSPAKSRKTWKWVKIVEFVVVSFATWLNPEAAFLIFLLKLCFQILELL